MREDTIIIFLIIICVILLIICVYFDHNKKNKENKDFFNKPSEDKKERAGRYNINKELNDIPVSENNNENIKTVSPPLQHVDYTYFNDKHKRNTFNIGIEPQSPLQTERNLSFTINP
jgi:hypothetical protein